MIHVEPAPKPDTFDEFVGKPGNAIVERLLKEYGRSDGIPRREFRSLRTENRETDGNRALDDLIDADGGMCAYPGVYMERTAGCPTVDHHIPLSRDCGKAYDWSNYRANCKPPLRNWVEADRRTWCTGIPWVPMPCTKVAQLGPLDAFLRNARLWVVTFSTERCIPTGCEVSQLALRVVLSA